MYLFGLNAAITGGYAAPQPVCRQINNNKLTCYRTATPVLLCCITALSTINTYSFSSNHF